MKGHLPGERPLVFGAFQKRLADFRWETLQGQANAWASDGLLLHAEFAHKALGALLPEDREVIEQTLQIIEEASLAPF